MSAYQSEAWWDDERIRWYDKAAVQTEFHSLLAKEIEKHISKEERILELGAGLGYVSEILMNDGYDLTASDNDENALAAAKKRTGFNDRFILLDSEKEEIPQIDTLLMIFFGHIKENGNLEKYLRSAGKIIYIISEHRGQGEDSRRFREPDDTVSFLEKTPGITFSHHHFSAAFNQPLDNEEDAARFLKRMYKDSADKYAKYIIHDNDGLLLPNEKHTSIFIIRRSL